MNQNTDRLTSPEIANLWTHYIRETMGICVIKYMHKNIQDSEIKKFSKLLINLLKSI